MRKLVALALFLALLVAIDFLLRIIATRQIGSAVATRLGLPVAPSVSISGFPFVTQAISGQYDAISAHLPPTTFGPVSNVAVSVDLLGVRVPLTDALAGNVEALTASSAQLRVTIPVASIAAAAHLPSLQISREGTGLRLATTVDLAGQRFPVSADLQATVVNSTLQLRSGALSGAGVTLPAELMQSVGTVLNLDVPLTGLPFTVTRGNVSVVGSDLAVDATATDLDFASR